MTNDDRIMRRAPQAFLGGIFVPVLAISLIFGNTFVGFCAVLLGLFTLLLALLPMTQRGLLQLLSTSGSRGSMALIIPILAVAGIFGNSMLMALVLLLAGMALLFAVIGARPSGPFWEAGTEAQTTASPPLAATELQALPAQASGEPVNEIDLRALCRGLPASLSGEIISTVEHLELVAVQAGQSSDTRRAYSARQGLRDYLPNAVSAWKALPEQERNPAELARALQQIREIAGTDEQSADSARKAWEVQQRFLNSKAEKSGN